MPASLSTPNAKKIIELSLAGKTYSEIAEVIGLSESYVLVIRWRARKAGIAIPSDPRRKAGSTDEKNVKRRNLRKPLPVTPDEGNEKWQALSDVEISEEEIEEALRDE